MSSELIPFGKYKGQPIEVISRDKKYLDWLTAQSWFREQYGNLYQIVINNFCEPSETPEHNALQARFLDPAFRLKFAAAAIPKLWWYAQADGEMIRQAARFVAEWQSAKDAARDAKIADITNRVPSRWDKNDPDRSARRIDEINQHHSLQTIGWLFTPLWTSDPKFEQGGRDVEFSVACGLGGNRFDSQFMIQDRLTIEIKPDIGDDYPAVLRQMRRNNSKYLFARSYHGTGVDRKTFLMFMKSQKISVFFEHEVDEAEDLTVTPFDEKKFLALVESEKQISDL